jgi:plastocyanin
MTVRSRLSLCLVSLTFVFLLFPGPAAAEPSLGLNPQSTAHYQLLAALRSVQACSASPSNYTFVACGPQAGLRSTTTSVSVVDDGKCQLDSASCSFVPASVTINEGDTVSWHNLGNLNHTIIFDSGGFSSIFLVNSSLQFKSSQPFPPFVSSSGFRTFDISGVFGYHDSIYQWMRGTITVNSLPSVPPRVQETNTTGPVTWIVIGLDDNAILSFNHALTTSANSTGSTRTSTNESGTLEETIDLSTREETPGLASQFRYLPPIFLSNLGIGSNGLGYLPYYYYPPQTLYTIWWINGPVQIGSTIELLTSTGAVRGSGTFQLSGSALPFWSIQSDYADSYNQSQPGGQQIIPIVPNPPIFGIGGFQGSYPEYYTAGASNTVSIALEYGQKSDLLFSTTANTRNYYKQVTVYPAGSYIYPYYGGLSTLVTHGVNVTNTYDSTVQISLTLESTNLDLSQRTTPPPTGGGGTQSPTANAPSAMMPWLYTTIGAVAAAGVAIAVWIGTRLRKVTPSTLHGQSAVLPAG